MGLDNNDIKQLIAILQKGLSDDNDDDDTSVPEPSTKKKKPKTQKKTLTKKTQNLFEGMPESKMHKDDIEIDRRLRKMPPTERSRNFKPIRVRCRVCGKEEEISPNLVESIDRYKCNKCSISAG